MFNVEGRKNLLCSFGGWKATMPRMISRSPRRLRDLKQQSEQLINFKENFDKRVNISFELNINESKKSIKSSLFLNHCSKSCRLLRENNYGKDLKKIAKFSLRAFLTYFPGVKKYKLILFIYMHFTSSYRHGKCFVRIGIKDSWRNFLFFL